MFSTGGSLDLLGHGFPLGLQLWTWYRVADFSQGFAAPLPGYRDRLGSTVLGAADTWQHFVVDLTCSGPAHGIGCLWHVLRGTPTSLCLLGPTAPPPSSTPWIEKEEGKRKRGEEENAELEHGAWTAEAGASSGKKVSICLAAS